MFRHNFIIGELLKGTREEVIARFVGHASVDMIRKHYAPFVQARDEAHLREAMKNR
jgi:integrase